MSRLSSCSAWRWKAPSWALQYGHHEPRLNRITAKCPANASGRSIDSPSTGVIVMGGKCSPGLSSGIVSRSFVTWGGSGVSRDRVGAVHWHSNAPEAHIDVHSAHLVRVL